jgi:hypothetical protein
MHSASLLKCASHADTDHRNQDFQPVRPRKKVTSVPKVKAKLQDGGVGGVGGGAVKTPPIVKRFIQIYSGYL